MTFTMAKYTGLSYSWDFLDFTDLGDLVPPSTSVFSVVRFPTHEDVTWGSPGAHIVTKCTKNMQQVSGLLQVVQLPKLNNKEV